MLSDMNTKHGRKVKGVDSEMLSRLMAHDWPGNVRELRNTIERAVILCGEGYAGNPPSAAEASANAFSAPTAEFPPTATAVCTWRLAARWTRRNAC